MNTKQFLAAGVLAGFAVLGLGGLGGAAIASAGGMNLNASGGAGTTVVPNSMKPAVQGTQDDDNDQDAWLHGSPEFTPQYKATGK